MCLYLSHVWLWRLGVVWYGAICVCWELNSSLLQASTLNYWIISPAQLLGFYFLIKDCKCFVNLIFYIYVSMCVYIWWIHAISGDERLTVWRSSLSSTMWVAGIKLRSSALAASSLTNLATLLSLVNFIWRLNPKSFWHQASSFLKTLTQISFLFETVWILGWPWICLKNLVGPEFLPPCIEHPSAENIGICHYF